MIAPSTASTSLASLHQEFIDALSLTAFSGDIACDYASRLAVATDNSIYQLIPEAVLFPRNREDVQCIMKLISQSHFHAITLTARGGGTAPNGQSLTVGLVLDFTRYMNAILEINRKEGWVTVQPGLILDKLNKQIEPYQLYFAPRISTKHRATIGGMVGTNACGLGALKTKRTANHLISLECVLADGSVFKSEYVPLDEWPDFINKASPRGQMIYTRVRSIVEQHLVHYKKLPDIPRGLGGYCLPEVVTSEGVNLNALLCGAEGTLAVITACKLQLTPIPSYRSVIVLKYAKLADALHEQVLALCEQISAAELIDETIIDVLRKSTHYPRLRCFVEASSPDKPPIKALSILEISADTQKELEGAINQFSHYMMSRKASAHRAIDYEILDDPNTMGLAWEVRQRGVEIVTQKHQGSRQPIPFIEDTAVSPDKLADYIMALRKLLDKHQLTYGMYGHLDAGCIHVRPALDLRLAKDVVLLRRLFNEVKALITRYGGVIWGEHGQGFKSEYGPDFWGEALYGGLCAIKKLFDPHNQLNPGKLATPSPRSDQKLMTIDSHLRGAFDKQISYKNQRLYSPLLACNGNGLCFDYRPEQLMCPSFKATQNRIHSPKGRAVLLREWLRQKKPSRQFAKEVYQAMEGCLGCKACTSLCPVTVDIPEFKSKFLSDYHQYYWRPWRDHLIAATEPLAYWQAKRPYISRCAFALLHYSGLNRYVFKLIDLPRISTKTVVGGLRKRRATFINETVLETYKHSKQSSSILLVQDAFTSFYQPDVFLSAYDFFTSLGVKVYIVPFHYSGKPLHHKGYRQRLKKVANATTGYFNRLAQLGIPMVGIEPSITLFYRQEYKKLSHEQIDCIRPQFNLLLPEEWLMMELARCKQAAATSPPNQDGKATTFYLFEHCSEQAYNQKDITKWVAVFKAFNLELKPLLAGCCGMAGIYGHEREHYKYSNYLFQSSWATPLLESQQANGVVLATGYSCRHQAKRLQGVVLKHPLEVLKEAISTV